MKELKLLEEIKRDVEFANSRRSQKITWKNWQASDIFETYNISSKTVKAIIRRAIKTDGVSLIEDLAKVKVCYF